MAVPLLEARRAARPGSPATAWKASPFSASRRPRLRCPDALLYAAGLSKIIAVGRRNALGGTPTTRLNARLNAASDS